MLVAQGKDRTQGTSTQDGSEWKMSAEQSREWDREELWGITIPRSAATVAMSMSHEQVEPTVQPYRGSFRVLCVIAGMKADRRDAMVAARKAQVRS